MSDAAANRSGERSRADVAIIGSAVGLSVIGLLAIAVVVIVGVAGATPSATLTWVGMISLPVAFILVLIEAGRAIARRRSA